jgi:hypothetical protein
MSTSKKGRDAKNQERREGWEAWRLEGVKAGRLGCEKA